MVPRLGRDSEPRSGSHLELLALGARFVHHCPLKGFWFAKQWRNGCTGAISVAHHIRTCFYWSGMGSKAPHPRLQVWLPPFWDQSLVEPSTGEAKLGSPGRLVDPWVQTPGSFVAPRGGWRLIQVSPGRAGSAPGAPCPPWPSESTLTMASACYAASFPEEVWENC